MPQGAHNTVDKTNAESVSVSIVIRAYNEEAHIGRLLSGIAAQRVQPREVILVDSGSTDKTVTIAESFGVRVVHIAKEDFTFGHALNVGCEAANEDILAFVSAHVYPIHNTWLEKLIAPFENPRVVLSYGGQEGGDTNKYSEHRLFTQWFPAQRACPQENYFCNNANCAVRRSVWEHLRYDETLTGLEDLDWAKRAQAAGGWLAYEPDATIAHVHEETWRQVRNRYRREAIALRRIETGAHFSIFDFVRLLVANVVMDAVVARKHGVLLKEWMSIILFRFNQFFGAWQGHRDPSDISKTLKRRFYFPTRVPHPHPDYPPEDSEGHRIDYSRHHRHEADERT